MKRKSMPPRNHVVVALIKRRGDGVHGKTFKAQRRQDKIEINGMVAKRPGTRLLTGYTASSILPRPTNFPAIQATSKEDVSIDGCVIQLARISAS